MGGIFGSAQKGNEEKLLFQNTIIKVIIPDSCVRLMTPSQDFPKHDFWIRLKNWGSWCDARAIRLPPNWSSTRLCCTIHSSRHHCCIVMSVMVKSKSRVQQPRFHSSSQLGHPRLLFSRACWWGNLLNNTVVLGQNYHGWQRLWWRHLGWCVVICFGARVSYLITDFSCSFVYP